MRIIVPYGNNQFEIAAPLINFTGEELKKSFEFIFLIQRCLAECITLFKLIDVQAMFYIGGMPVSILTEQRL
jgi:hypothetical protein